jgi:EAL domain-containing protein (putative c-di-GMP-specific phosphodiesterase class I)
MDVEPGWRRAEADDLESGMRLAADKGELFLLYQPEVDLNRGEVVAVEALTRWLHPQRGELGPDSFIALAEQSELIQVLGAWLIEESFRDFGSWQQTLGDAVVALRVNVSPAQLSRPGVPEQFAAALRRHGLRGEQVCVELTENLEVLDVAAVARALDELRKLGIKTAIDDLGSGYSGLSRLRTFDVDFVKLDRGLVQGIDGDPRARAIVRGVVATAAELGMGVIAEGVESEADADTLRALGCHSAQGHYFARPMNGADTLAYLGEHGRRSGG